MKKTIFYSLLLAISLFIVGCSRSDDSDSGSKNETQQKLIGKWYFGDPAVYGYKTNNSFTFTSNGKVTYTYWAGGNSGEFESETGTYKLNGDILTMVYPDKVTLTFIQKVVFKSDKIVEFKETGKSGAEPYDGTYYKA